MSFTRYFFILAIFTICYTSIIQAAPRKKAASKPKGYTQVVVSDSVVYDGLKYSNILFGSRKNKISANVLELDVKNPRINVSVMKAKNNIFELDKLHRIIDYSDDINQSKTLAAVNGSFWRAYRNSPIGACIINGNVVEMNPYKEWSSIFFDKSGNPYIDNFKLSGKVRLHDGKVINISTVNRRSDSMGLVFYNVFGGETIPHINNNKMDDLITNAYEKLMQDSTFMTNDLTEGEFDFAEFENSLIENARSDQMESSIRKALIEFIDKPGINRNFRGIVNYIDTGAVRINNNQALLSLGFNLPPDLTVYSGDTLTFKFGTNVHSDINFDNAASATPRLVRNGEANHEAQFEGSRSRRFINGALARTAIGYNKDKSKLYVVTIDHSNNAVGKKGASLGELSQIMKQIGCFDAMNLDGGGSSIMVIDGKNIMSKNRPEAGRRISVGIGVRVKK